LFPSFLGQLIIIINYQYKNALEKVLTLSCILKRSILVNMFFLLGLSA